MLIIKNRLISVRNITNVAVLCFIILLTWSTGRAQSSTDGSTPLSIQPGAPAGSLGLDDFENVNLFNGNLNFTLPLYKVIGRGEAAVPGKLTY